MSVAPYNNKGLLNFNTYKPTYIGRPIQALGTMMGKMDANNKKISNNLTATDIALSNLNINPNDDGAKEAIEMQRKKFEDTRNSILNSNDYSIANAIIAKSGKDFITNQHLKQSVANNELYNNQREEWRKEWLARKLSDKAYNDAMRQPAPNTIDEGNGMYSMYKAPHYAKYYDATKDLLQYAKGFDKNITSYDPKFTHNPDGSISGYSQLTTETLDEPRLRHELNNIINSNSDMKASIEQEARLEGITTKQYKDRLIDSVVEQNNAAKIQNRGVLYKLSTASPTLFGGKRYIAQAGIVPETNFGQSANKLTSTLPKIKQLNEASAINANSISLAYNALTKSIKNGTSFSDELHKGIKESGKESLDSYIKGLDSNEQYLYNLMNSRALKKYGKSLDNLTSQQAKTLSDDINLEIANNPIMYESPYGPTMSVPESKLFTTGIFGWDNLHKNKDGTFTPNGAISQYSIYIPKTGKFYNSWDELNADIAKGDIKYKLPGGVKKVVGANKNMPVKIIAPLNNGNSITYQTDNYAFSNGFIANLDGLDIVLGDNSNLNPNSIYSNLVSQTDKFKGMPVDATSQLHNIIGSDNIKAIGITKDDRVYFKNNMVDDGNGNLVSDGTFSVIVYDKNGSIDENKGAILDNYLEQTYSN